MELLTNRNLVTQQVKAGVGVRCNLTEKGVSGKPTVTHNLKKYALNLAGLVGVDYAKISHLGSHDRDVTRNHYLTVCLDAMHRSACTLLPLKTLARGAD